jgi:hypothetical protein
MPYDEKTRPRTCSFGAPRAERFPGLDATGERDRDTLRRDFFDVTVLPVKKRADGHFACPA